MNSDRNRLYDWRKRCEFFTDSKTLRWYAHMPRRLLKEDPISLDIERIQLFLNGTIDLALGKSACPIRVYHDGCQECPLPQEVCFDMKCPEDIYEHLRQKALPALEALRQQRQAE